MGKQSAGNGFKKKEVEEVEAEIRPQKI